MPDNPALAAAKKIDEVLGNAVVCNTGVKTGYFSGVSVDDIAEIIRAAYAGRK